MCRIGSNSSLVSVEREFDPILEIPEGQKQQFCLFPIRYPDIFRMYKEAVASFWTIEELDLTRDRADYEKLSPAEQTFIKHVLGFFAASDGLVNENLCTNFSEEVVCQEAKCFYAFQQAIESVHAETYSLLLDTIISDQTEKNDLFNALETMSCIKTKAEFMQKHMTRDSPFEERLVAFACVEGILFSSSFCAIYFFKQKNLMPGLTISNQFISRDEALHSNFAVLLYSHLKNKLTTDKIQEIVKEAVEVESVFVRNALSGDILGINADEMVIYVEMIADRLLVDLGCEKVYNAVNPFLWMQNIALQGVSSFFEVRNDSYAKANVGVSAEEAVFSTDCNF